MAILVPGMRCPLCYLPMMAGDKLASFPPFVANKKDPLIFFSDAVFHAHCFRAHPLADRATDRYEAIKAHLGPGRRLCAACAQPIINPDDYFTAGHLTDNPSSPLFEFNYVQLHRSHFGRWDKFPTFRRLVEEFQSSDAWDGRPILSLSE
jgi:hypothetical protein